MFVVVTVLVHLLNQGLKYPFYFSIVGYYFSLHLLYTLPVVSDNFPTDYTCTMIRFASSRDVIDCKQHTTLRSMMLVFHTVQCMIMMQ